MRKRNILLTILLVLLVLSAVSSALTFRTRTGQVTNRITYGDVELTLIENTPVKVSGGEYSRIVRVKNTGEHPIYVRVALRLTAVDKDGQETTLPADFYSFDINNNDWIESDGWYYYNHTALTANEETNTLMTKIMFDHTKLNDVAGYELTLHIQAEGVQSENNGETVWQAEGWPADEGGVTP